MGGLITKITHVMYVIMVLLALVIIGLAVFYVQSKKKHRAKVNDVRVCSDLKRKDVQDFVRLENIKDDMVITENGTRFIGAVRCYGYDFYSANAPVRERTMMGYINFIASIKTPVTYRQYTKQTDLGPTKEMYKNTYEKLLEQLYDYTDEYSLMKEELESIRDKDIVREKAVLSRLEELQKKIKSLAWREYHMRDEMAYLERVSSSDTTPERVEMYVFEWVYDESMFSHELSDEEIYKKAIQELKAAEHNMAFALGNAGVKAVRMRTGELIEAFRQHNNPVSSEHFRMKDVANTSYYNDIIGSSCVSDMREEVHGELAEEIARKSAQILLSKAGDVRQMRHGGQKAAV